MSRYATARAVTGLTALAVLSPVAGMGVEMALAWRFGSSPTVDAFRIGALLLLFGQQLFVIQILPHAVVPVFAEYRARGREQEAWHVAMSLANLLLLPAVAIAALVLWRPEPVAAWLAPGLAGEARVAAALFVRWFFPACALLVWNGVMAGVLYAHRIFWLPPAAQLAGNLVLVVSILTLGRTRGAASLIVGVLLAAGTSFALYASRLMILLRQAGVRFSWKPDLAHPGVRQALALAAPLLGTLLLGQWVAIVINRALSTLPPGNLALFGYAWKLGQMASLVPISLATVLFPRFADVRFAGDSEAFRGLCTRALRMALFIVLPLVCLLAALRGPVVALVLERGAFSPAAAQAVARLFGLLLLGAPAAAAMSHLEKMFYAAQQTRIPLVAQFGSAAGVTLLAPGVAQRYGAGGLMILAGAVLVWMTSGTLFLVLHARYRALAANEIVWFAAGVLLLALLSASAARAVNRAVLELLDPGLLSTGLGVAAGLLAGGVVFFTAAMALRVREALEWRDYLLWQSSATVRRVQAMVMGRT